MKKYLSIFVCLALCISMLFVFSSSAAEAEDLTFGGLIEQETIESLGHKYISSNLAEHLSAIEFVNEDDTRTIYTFDKPIKYVDKAGAVKRIDNTLVKTANGKAWKNNANAFELAVHEDVAKGVTLSYQDDAITVVPNVSAARGTYTAAKRADGKAVSFQNAQSDISYEATYDGYITAVTVPAGQSPSFSATLSGDISAVTANGTEVAVTMANGTVVKSHAYFATVSEQRLEDTEFQAQVTCLSDSTYRLTYSMPTVLTASAQIVISSKVSPASGEVQPRNAGTTIPTTSHADACVFSNFSSTNYGTQNYYSIGTDSSAGICRAYVRFDLSALSHVPYDRILSANYHAVGSTNNKPMLQIEAYMVTGAWTETTITWANKPAYNSEKLTTVNVGPNPLLDVPGYYDFYITQAVMAWKQGIPNYGIMLKSRVETGLNFHAFRSREYVNNPPQLSVTYVTDTTSMENIGIRNNGIYYVKNKNSNLYLTATGTADYSNVTQTTWTGVNAQKWQVKSQGNGYFKLVPRSATGMVLDTNGGNNTDGANIQIHSANTGLGQEFKFIRNWDGSYRIVTRLSGGTRGLRAENDNTTNGGNICHWTQTTNWMKSDDWTLEAAGGGIADVFTFTYEPNDGYGLDTAQYAEPIISALDSMRYGSANSVDANSANAYDWMSDDAIWVFNGHGGTGCVQFKDGGLISSTETGDNFFPVSDKVHNALSKLKLAAFCSCSTGADDASRNTNLVGMMYRKGTHFVTAISAMASSPVSDYWLQEFFANCAGGKTVYEAMIAADDFVYEHHGWDSVYGSSNQRHYLGDNSLRLDRY